MEQPIDIQPKIDASPYPISIRYGIIGGIISIIFAAILYLTDLTMSPVAYLSFLISIGVIFMGIKTHRDNDLGGYIGLGRGTWVGVIIAFIMTLLSSIWNILLMTVIDTNYNDKMLENLASQYEESGMPEEQIEMTMEIVGKFMGPTGMTIFGLLGGIIIGALIGLVCAAILKKEHPEDM